MFTKILRNAVVFLLIGVMAFSVVGCKGSNDSVEKINKNENVETESTETDESTENGKSEDKTSSSSNKKEEDKISKVNSKKPGSTTSSNKNTKCDFHKYTTWKSSDKNYHTSKCTKCSKTAKVKHIWNDGDISVKPTASSAGKIKFTCQICATTKTEKITYVECYGDDYSSPRKTAEVYNAAATRKLKLFSAAYSDNNYAALYGECPVGLGVLVQTKDGCFNVDSNMGNFAIRIESEEYDTEIDISLWHRGKQITKNEVRSLNIYTSDYDTDPDGWKPIIGSDNLGYFEKIYHVYNGSMTFSDDALKSAVNKYRDRISTLKQINKDAEIICLMIPSAVSVYSENVHDTMKYSSSNKYLSLGNELKKAGVTVIDLQSAFKAHKNDKLPIYNRYDTHWTDYGAYIAYVELYKHISKKFPAAAPRKFNDFKWTEGYFYGSDIPSYFGVDEKPGKYVSEYSVRREMTSKAPAVIKNINRFKSGSSVAFDSYSDEAMGMNIYDTKNSSLPNVSVIRNSFGVQIQDIIAERSNVAVINAMWDYKFNVQQYKENKTDYIIYVLSEWELDRITNN